MVSGSVAIIEHDPTPRLRDALGGEEFIRPCYRGEKVRGSCNRSRSNRRQKRNIFPPKFALNALQRFTEFDLTT